MKFTVKDYIDAVRKNGYPQLRAKLWEYDYNQTGKVRVAGCAAGQAIWNLNPYEDIPLSYRLNQIYVDRSFSEEATIAQRLFAHTVRLNDGPAQHPDEVEDYDSDSRVPALSLEKIADRLEVLFADELEEIFFEY